MQTRSVRLSRGKSSAAHTICYHIQSLFTSMNVTGKTGICHFTSVIFISDV